MNDDYKPNGGDGDGDDGSDDNIVVIVTGKHRYFSCYINMGYPKKVLFCVLLLFFIVTNVHFLIAFWAVKFARK
jgi:hypothetical protein